MLVELQSLELRWTLLKLLLMDLFPSGHFPAGGSYRGKSSGRDLCQCGMRSEETHVVRREVPILLLNHISISCGM